VFPSGANTDHPSDLCRNQRFYALPFLDNEN
jgi:hypothetical protein